MTHPAWCNVEEAHNREDCAQSFKVERAERGDGKWITTRVWLNVAPTSVVIYDRRNDGQWISEMRSDYGNVRFTAPVVAPPKLVRLLDDVIAELPA